MESRCRLCAECSIDQMNVFEKTESEYVEKILHLFHIEINTEDRLPTTICQLCCKMVNQMWDFNQRIQKSQALLVEMFNKELGLTFCSDAPEDIVSCVILDPKKADDAGVQKIIKPTTSTKIRLIKKKSDDSELSDFEENDDDSVTPKEDLLGWDTYPWRCCDCHQNLTSVEILREHFATIHGHPCRYSCNDCPKIYTKYSTFLTHVKVHRLKLRFNCDICFKWFQTVAITDNHRNNHGVEKLRVCQTCGKGFRMQSTYIGHVRSHLPADLKNRHQCDQCPKRFSTKPNLMAHKRIHAGVRDFTCDQCGKSFVQKGNLDNHLLSHTAVRPFACLTCGKAFKTLVRLRKHDSVHSGLKPHQCDICGRKFRERGTLKEHHRIHTGAMPFKCEFCGKSFRFKGVLTTHRRQHTGERPYSCHECQHHFTNWPNYNKHMKRRHGINTSVTVRKPQTIPPTGMPHRNPPGTVLAPPQLIGITENFAEASTPFYAPINIYNLPEEILQQRV